MNVKEAIQKRRSIRNFRPGPIPEEQLQILMKAAQLAPSASNNQPYKFIIVKDDEVKKRLQRLGSIQDFITDAAVIFVGVGFAQYEKWNKVNLGIAIQHIFLQAVELGLGACWIGAFNEEKVKKVLQIPQDMNVIALLPVGIPDEDPPARPRKSIEDLFSMDNY
ncbi:MAG: nitroreductase family protein [Candidatus Helarchaeota archaeon]|nr:nitroreductase family protein [Candidatus Helarchaeota archaeon]